MSRPLQAADPRPTMLIYIAKRIVYTLPIMLGVAFVCFLLVHMAPGDPLVSVLPPDASESLKQQMMVLYGFDRPYSEQFFKWLFRTAPIFQSSMLFPVPVASPHGSCWRKHRHPPRGSLTRLAQLKPRMTRLHTDEAAGRNNWPGAHQTISLACGSRGSLSLSVRIRVIRG